MFTWRSPDLQTIIWPPPDPYLTLISSLQLKKSCVVGGGGGGGWIKPLQTLSQGLVLTFDFWLLALSLTIKGRKDQMQVSHVDRNMIEQSSTVP